MSALLADPATWAALAGLVAMEILLGIDNLVFLSLLTNKLPQQQQLRAQRIGVGLALIIRLMALVAVAYIVLLTTPVVSLFGHGFSWRDIILLAGGLFLIWKATTEIRRRIDPGCRALSPPSAGKSSFMVVVVEIPMFDIVFSVDSIITAVGMTEHLPIMMAAVIIAMAVMLLAASPLSAFLRAYPSLTILALGFLLLIGVTLVAEAFGTHFPRGYIYSAMAFSSLIVALDLLSRRAQHLRGTRNGSDTA
ncbi:hypothetical protein DK867_22780 [Ochrobactrum sp. POC9]|uniref:TerC family protein n=1 Tax=Ochrobactrum sp. POC9 TaxID=2203419 RepID=UPI000D705784|nr:TerC family protein [Ochrobactrum sp. POC9]PWU70793.1 hypothetical protein DK867_22780 [Ochrobactrum sp. POC9]